MRLHHGHPAAARLADYVTAPADTPTAVADLFGPVSAACLVDPDQGDQSLRVTSEHFAVELLYYTDAPDHDDLTIPPAALTAWRDPSTRQHLAGSNLRRYAGSGVDGDLDVGFETAAPTDAAVLAAARSWVDTLVGVGLAFALGSDTGEGVHLPLSQLRGQLQ